MPTQPTISERPFYRVLIPVELISAQPIPELPLVELLPQLNQGVIFGRVLPYSSPENQPAITATAAVAVLAACNQAPTVLGLNAQGEDLT